jgi:prepilin-type N-terminal cleavage/methylation domain-containing protein
MRHAFTLIELLVVITIIVVLLALLTPALDKAIYQAELLQCAGRLKALGAGVTQYTFDSRRYYPDRGMNRQDDQPLSRTATTLYSPAVDLDMRPALRPYMDINILQCHFPGTIELDRRPVEESDVLLESSYTLWWGWRYKFDNRTFRGMFKFGDSFSCYDYAPGTPPQSVRNFTVLAGDLDLTYPQAACTSHPDGDPSVLAVVRYDPGVFIGRFASSWFRGDKNRGLLDNNFVFADGSTRRYSQIANMNAPRASLHPDMARVPVNYDNTNNRGVNSDKYHIPRN